jgi:hypothetical protein
MQTIGALLGSQIRAGRGVTELLPDVGGVGLELELENGRFDQVAGWNMHEDGSLRGGVEYVFDGPQGGLTALTSIENMAEAFKTMQPMPTFRCSTHCHLDMRDFTMYQVAKFVALYAINEDVMFDHCEEYRRWSNFCTPYYNALDLVEGFAGMVRSDFSNPKKATGGTSLRNVRAFPKYSALNLQPLSNFGSVEFRGSHALKTKEGLLSLVQRMLHLKRVVSLSPDEESLADFVHRVNKLPLNEVFLQGLDDGYQRDRDLADTCFATALHLLKVLQPVEAQPNPMEGLRRNGLAHGELNLHHAWRADPFVGAGVADRVVVDEDEAGDWMAQLVEINRNQLPRYGLRDVQHMTVREFCQMFSAIRRLQGIPREQRPTVANMIAMGNTHPDTLRIIIEELQRRGVEFN